LHFYQTENGHLNNIKSEGQHINNIFITVIKFTTWLFKINQCTNNFKILLWNRIYQKNWGIKRN